MLPSGEMMPASASRYLSGSLKNPDFFVPHRTEARGYLGSE
jgi:hypothetical protein